VLSPLTEKQMLKILEQLLKPRNIISFAIYWTFCWGIINEKIPMTVLLTILGTLMGFYFGEKVGNGNHKKEV